VIRPAVDRSLRWVGLAAVLTLTSTGCAGAGSSSATSPGLAVTASPTSTNPAEPSGTGSATSASPGSPASASASAAARDPLTRAQVVAALPPPTDFGAAWRDATSSRSMTSIKDAITPATCRPLYDQLAGDPLVPLVATAKRDYRPGEGGPFVTVVVRSFPQAPGDSVLTPVAQALGSCPTFTSLTTAGRTTSYRATPLTFPEVGDKALAFQLVATSQDFSITLQVALTAIGSTEVSVVNASIGKLSQPSMTLTAMTRTLARLPR